MPEVFGPWKQCLTPAVCSCSNHSLPSVTLDAEDDFLENPSYHHLVRSNTIPLQNEERAITSQLNDLRDEQNALEVSQTALLSLRTTYENSLLEISQKLESFSQRILQIRNAIDTRMQVLSPIRRIPTEILQAIFFHLTLELPVPVHLDDKQASESDYLEFYAFSTDSHQLNALWNLVPVCQNWRDAALSKPSLWSTISICISPTNFGPNASNYLPRIGRHLMRSGHHPLTVVIYPSREIKEDMAQFPETLTGVLVPFASRIRDLSLFLPPSFISNLSPLCTQLESLNRLAIHHFPLEEHTDGSVDVFQNCSLTDVTMTDILDPSSFNLNWPSIERLELFQTYSEAKSTGTTANDIYEAIRKSDALQHLSIHLDIGVEVDLTPFTCEHLNSLNIVCYYQDLHPLEHMMENLTLPVLKNLKVALEARSFIERNGDVLLSGEHFTAVVDMVWRSNCPLETFEYVHGEFPVDHVLRLLDVSPLLVQLVLLEIDSPGMASAVAKKLTVLNTQSVPLPRLRVLTLGGWLHSSQEEEDEPEAEVDVFIKCARTRWEARTLERMTLKWEPCPEAGVLSVHVQEDLATIREGLAVPVSEGLVYDGVEEKQREW